MESILTPFLELLHEVYLGTEGQHTFVIDNNPGNALLPAIKKLSASDASTPSHQGGTTVAAHTGHLVWSINFALEFFKGNVPKSNWEESWTRISVNETEWKQLQDELASAVEQLTDAIKSAKDWSNPVFLKGTLALLPHASYHLGAIKQLILAVKPEKAALGLQ